MSLGFLEVSLGRYAEALSTFQPLLEALDASPGTQIMTAMYIADAVEAMIALGRNADAEPVARGKVTSVCCRGGPDHALEAVTIPATYRARLEQ